MLECWTSHILSQSGDNWEINLELRSAKWGGQSEDYSGVNIEMYGLVWDVAMVVDKWDDFKFFVGILGLDTWDQARIRQRYNLTSSSNDGKPTLIRVNSTVNLICEYALFSFPFRPQQI